MFNQWKEMKPRTEISAADLYVLLNRELKRRQARECAVCYIPLPFRIDRYEDGANWEIIPPPDCGGSCAQVIDEIFDEYASQYDLKPPGDDPAA
jgi:hypothetical protein